MTKSKKSKKALFSSLLAMMLCFAMLVGTTFAWFTDSVTAGSNRIVAGNLNIDLGVKTKGDTDYVSIKENPAKAVFDYDLWEPGYTEWANVKVYTTGNLALKYTMRIVANGQVSALADVIDVYYAPSEIAKPTTRDLSGLTRLGTLADVLVGGANVTINDTLIPGTNEEDFATIALHMQETAGNEYQGLSIGTNFAFQVLATQYTYEADSFGIDYDENADYDYVPVASITEVPDADITGIDINVVSVGVQNVTLDEAFEFAATEDAATAAASDYADYNADFVVYADKDVGAGEILFAGMFPNPDPNGLWAPYDDLWIGFESVDVPAGNEVRLVKDGIGATVTYEELCGQVRAFECGVKDSGVAAGTKLTVELRLYKTVNGVETGEYVVAGSFTYTF